MELKYPLEKRSYAKTIVESGIFTQEMTNGSSTHEELYKYLIQNPEISVLFNSLTAGKVGQGLMQKKQHIIGAIKKAYFRSEDSFKSTQKTRLEELHQRMAPGESLTSFIEALQLDNLKNM